MQLTERSKPRLTARPRAAAPRRPRSHTDLFWSVDRAERVRLIAELARHNRRAVVLCRSGHDASRLAGDLSRHGVPAASSDQRDFLSERVRVQVLTDETLADTPPPPAPLVVQFDPAASPRHYRRRVAQAALASAAVITFVVPERRDEGARLASRLRSDLVLTPPDVASARSVAADGTPGAAPPAGSAFAAGPRARGRAWSGGAYRRVRAAAQRVEPALDATRHRVGARLKAWLPSRLREG